MGNETMTTDDVFAVLSHEHRRRILNELHDLDRTDDTGVSPEVFVDELVDGEAVAIELFHNHLPKLESTGFIEWDRQRDVVRRGPCYEAIGPVIDVMVENGDSLSIDWP